MRTQSANLPVEGPGQDDCGRLLFHLRDEYCRDLRIEIGVYDMGRVGWGIKLEALNDALAGVSGEDAVNVWASKTFGQRISHIRMADLYDLLMMAHRTIDRYFAEGEAFAPARRVK